jgi:hypothetical protein
MQPITQKPIEPGDYSPVYDQNPDQLRIKFDVANTNRDTNALTRIAQEAGVDNPIGKAALAQVKLIQDSASEFKDKVTPIDKAGGATTPDGRQKIAQAFVSTADQPLYGQALVAYVLGQKEDAFKLFTGGTKKTAIEYANDNGNILRVVTNGLGEPISYYDTQDGRYLSQEEYSQRGGSLSALEKTMAYQTQNENRKVYNAAFQQEQQSVNNWNTTYQGLSPKIDYINEWFGKNKIDLPPEEFAKLLRTVSNSVGTASNVSKSKTAFDQLQKDASKADGVRVDDKIAAATGAAVGQVLKVSGDKLVSTDGKFNESLGTLKQKTETESQSAENSKNSAETFDSVVKSERFQNALKNKSAKEKALFIQQLETVLKYGNEVGTELSRTSDKYGKPSFISLPTSASFADPQALLMTQIAQHKHNSDQLNAYSNYFNKNVDMYSKNNTLPIPGAIANAFLKTAIYQDTKKNWASAIDNILQSEYLAQNAAPKVSTQPLKTETQPVAVAAPVPAPVVAPTAIPAAVVPPEPMSPAAAADRTSPAAPPPAAATVPKAAKLPKGIPAGSVETGKFAKNGKKVYRSPDGSLHVED